MTALEEKYKNSRFKIESDRWSIYDSTNNQDICSCYDEENQDLILQALNWKNKKEEEVEIEKAYAQIIWFYECYQWWMLKDLCISMWLEKEELKILLRDYDLTDILPQELWDELNEYWNSL